MFVMRHVLWVALLLCGCGNHRPAQQTTRVAPPVDAPAAPVDAGPLDQDLPRLARRALEMTQNVAAALAAAGDDCAVATQKLGELRDAYADVVAANAKVMHDGRAKEMRAALDPLHAQFDAAAQAIMGSKTLPKCSQDPAFAKAFDALFEAPP